MKGCDVYKVAVNKEMEYDGIFLSVSGDSSNFPFRTDAPMRLLFLDATISRPYS